MANKPEYKGITFDSEDEVHFYVWLEEAQELGLVHDFIYQPQSFELFPGAIHRVGKQLKTKIKYEDKTLLHPAKYTPDFLIGLDEVRYNKVFTSPHARLLRTHSTGGIYIDIKGGFIAHNDDAKFSVIRKWVYAKHNIYINKLQLKTFFKYTWVTDSARFTPKRKEPVKKYLTYPTFEQIKEKVDWL